MARSHKNTSITGKRLNNTVKSFKNISIAASWVIVVALLLVIVLKHIAEDKFIKPEKEQENTEFWAYDGTDKVILPESLSNTTVPYKGFIVYFNPETHIPNAVAYELTSSEAKGVEPRYNNFDKDYEVEGCPHPSDYTGSGYDRGHMAPAADMKWDKQAMKESCTMTNICPQNGKLNRGMWNKLEDSIHKWAQRDSSIVVVCGPILGEKKKYIKGDGMKIAVPEGFFKVILANRLPQPRAIGFVMPNKTCGGQLEDYAMSIDEVEKLTGFDFFSILPDNVENELERTCNYQQWTAPER